MGNTFICCFAEGWLSTESKRQQLAWLYAKITKSTYQHLYSSLYIISWCVKELVVTLTSGDWQEIVPHTKNGCFKRAETTCSTETKKSPAAQKSIFPIDVYHNNYYYQVCETVDMTRPKKVHFLEFCIQVLSWHNLHETTVLMFHIKQIYNTLINTL